jgi:exodeoxyribonuclease VII large subunit
MTQFGFMSILQPDEPMSVSDVTARVKDLLEGDDVLANVRVAGEIGNISRPASGHIYFTLKDGQSQIKCAMWRQQAQRLRAVPKQGDAVVARGRVGVYERDGAYQLYVEALVQGGAGDLHAEFERLKQMLADEGLFDQSRKRPLPVFPRRLGVVTSSSGAAFQDILNVLGRRYPLVEVLLAHTLVQGAEAPAMIVQAINRLCALPESAQPDVILVARGGGSLEELWAFNDERVARAIAACPIPVVSGVGHEIDFTLADFAADLRAPTPSAAAELITPDLEELRQTVDDVSAGLRGLMALRIGNARSQVMALWRALRHLSPASAIEQQRRQLNALRERMAAARQHMIDYRRLQVDGVRSALNALGPQATLARGYAIVLRDGAVVKHTSDVHAGDALTLRVSDGDIAARVKDG